MKFLFIKDGVVVGHAMAHADGVVVTCNIPGAEEHQVGDDSPVDVGWACELVDSSPVFTAPAPLLPLLTPMTLYMAFKPQERIDIKKSSDELVVEFWATYDLSVKLNRMFDPNLESNQKAIAYLAQLPSDSPPGPGILKSKDRIQQILAGMPQ